MSLEIEMLHEIERLEEELDQMDSDIEKLQTKVANMMNIRKKKEYDLKILRENFGLQEEDRKELQTDLTLLMRRKL